MGVFDFLIVVFGKNLSAIVIDYVGVRNNCRLYRGVLV